MKRATIEERKRFAAELAARDARASQDPQVGLALGAQCVEVVPSRSACEESGSHSRPQRVKASRTSLPPTDDELLVRYRMRRWWLERFTLDEIRELAECLQ